MITVRNDLHNTERELPDVYLGDTMPAHRAKRMALELCGIVGCAECGPLGERGPQQGFVAVLMDDGSVFISQLDNDFEGMAEQGHHQKNRSDRITEGRISDDDAKSDEKRPIKPNPVSEALNRLLTLRDSLDELPDHVRRWLHEAIISYLHGESPTLDQALCLCLPVSGTQPAGALYRYETRNRHLQSAAELIAPGQRPWKQAQELSKAIFDYTTGVLPANEVYNHIQAAHEIGPRVPSSPTGLAPILERK